MKDKDFWLRLGKAFHRWGPVLAQMVLIFFFSAQPADSSVLKQFPIAANLGHLGGYFILGFFLYRAINQGHFSWNLRAAVLTFSGGLIYAVSDEFHQLFVPGREATLLDLGLDVLGILIMLLLVRGREAIVKE